MSGDLLRPGLSYVHLRADAPHARDASGCDFGCVFECGCLVGREYGPERLRDAVRARLTGAFWVALAGAVTRGHASDSGGRSAAVSVMTSAGFTS